MQLFICQTFNYKCLRTEINVILSAHVLLQLALAARNLVIMILTRHKPKQVVNMITIYHNHKLHTKREEEPRNSHEIRGRQKSKVTSSLFPIKMVAKQELTQSNAQQNIQQWQNCTMGVATTTVLQQYRFRTNSNLRH